jgi:AcrR family transcriptional regulator
MDGLRERKKEQTRRALQAIAVRLCVERGFEHVTIEQIAEAAEVSPRTFFRYFPSKEDVIVWDGYDPHIAEAIAARPHGEQPMRTLREVLAQILPVVTEADGELIRMRALLMAREPALRRAMVDHHDATVAMFTPLLVERSDADPWRVELVVRAFVAMINAAVDRWATSGADGDLLPIALDAVDLLGDVEI